MKTLLFFLRTGPVRLMLRLWFLSKPAPRVRHWKKRLAGTAPWLVGAVTATITLTAGAGEEWNKVEYFEKFIRPVFVEHCYECHSTAARKAKGGLRLDSRADLLAGGDSGPAIVPGRPEESLLYKAISHQEPDLAMPAKKPKLPEASIASFKKWIADGAIWPGEVTSAPASAAKVPFDMAQRKQRLNWIWKTPHQQKLPDVKNRDWPRTDADYFILARQEAKGITPAPPAEAQTWLRRVYFAITGLPPSLSELHAFLADSSESAREKVVDRLLSSPHYGERWARHWMDLVRYAESRGHESDYIIANAYQYRDYLIRAFNEDLSYDRFVCEQIAGDLLPHPRLNPANGANESVLGTGWIFLGEENHSPVDIRQDECDRTDNKVDVLSKTFLGLTLACARCHDHKFDAITAQDYYAMSGFILSSSYRQVPFENMEYNHQIALELDSARNQARPKIAAAISLALRPGVKRLGDYLAASREVLMAKGDQSRSNLVAAMCAKYSLTTVRLDQWIDYIAAAAKNDRDPLQFVAAVMTDPEAHESTRLAELMAAAHAAKKRSLPGDARIIVDFSKPGLQPWKASGEAFGTRPLRPGEICFGADPLKPIAEIMRYGAARRDPFWDQLRAAPGNENDSGKIDATSRAGRMLATPNFTLGTGKLHYLIKGKAHVYAAVDSHIMIDGPLHGQLVQNFGSTNFDAPVWFTHDLSRYRGQRAHLEFGPDGDAGLEVLMVVESDEKPSWSPDAAPWLPDRLETSPAQLAFALQEAMTLACDRLSNDSLVGVPDGEDYATLANWLVHHTDLIGDSAGQSGGPEARALLARTRELEQKVHWESRTAVAWLDGTGVDEQILIRGKAGRTGPLAPRSLPAAFPGVAPIQCTDSSGRLELARQMTDPANTLLARVIVNRIWQHLFGRGIVATVDNFGFLGERPSNPELLDHLAWQFIYEDNWSQKKLIRRLVLSRTFSQRSEAGDAQAEEIDSDNVLLHRMPVRRLEGEIIRDAILAVSGRLNPAVGGPPVGVYLTEFLAGRGRPAQSGPLDGDGRRSIYTAVRRNFLPSFMLAFDVPPPSTTVGRRNVTNVPAQSLALMNDPLVQDQARVWSERLGREMPNASIPERIRWLFECAYARSPSATELEACRQMLSRLSEQDGEGAGSPETWSELCHVLFCANDFIYLK